MGANCTACDADFKDETINASKIRKKQQANMDRRQRESSTRRSESLCEGRSHTHYSELSTSFEKLSISPFEGLQSPRYTQPRRKRLKADADLQDLSIVHALLKIGDRVQMTNVTTQLEGKIGRITGPFSHFQNRWEVKLETMSQEVFVQPRNLRKLPSKEKYKEIPITLLIDSLPVTDSEKHTAIRNELFDFMNVGGEGSRISMDAIHIGLISSYGLHGFNFLPHLNLAFKALWKNRLCEEHFIDFDLFQPLLTALQKAFILKNMFHRYRDNEYFEYLDFRRSIDLLQEWNIEVDDCKAKYDYLEDLYYFTFDTFCTWAISESLKCFGPQSPRIRKKDCPAPFHHESSSSHTGSFREP